VNPRAETTNPAEAGSTVPARAPAWPERVGPAAVEGWRAVDGGPGLTEGGGPEGRREPGSYLLLFELAEAVELMVGRLGRFRLPAGWYIYCGSALGGLAARVARHVRGSPRRHWHVDYLRAVAPVRAVRLLPGAERRECALAAALLARPGAAVVVPRFGASDCRCPAHLIHFAAPPALDSIPVCGHGPRTSVRRSLTRGRRRGRR